MSVENIRPRYQVGSWEGTDHQQFDHAVSSSSTAEEEVKQSSLSPQQPLTTLPAPRRLVVECKAPASEEGVTKEEKDLAQTINANFIAKTPLVFGAPTWHYLHLWTLRYSVAPSQAEQESAVKTLETAFENLGCFICTTHSFEYARENPVCLSSRMDLVWWMFDFHNNVNKRLNKPEITRADFIRIYITEPGAKIQIRRKRANGVNQLIAKYATDTTGQISLAILIGVIVLVFILFCAWWYYYRKRHEKSP